jgi:LacI family transcriptional regulator
VNGVQRADITTIARELGISVATVHRALHDSGSVSESTRRRVLETAQRVGYRPNRIAQELRARKTFTIGVTFTGISSAFYASILDGVEEAAHQAGYSVLLGCSHDDPDKEREQIELLLEKRVAGIILSPADPSVSASYYSGLIEEGVRLVFVGRHVPGVPGDSVETNNALGGYLVGKHLAVLGRQRIGIVTTIAPKRQYTYVLERIAGCQQALQEHGLSATVIGEALEERMPLPRFAYQAVWDYLRKGEAVDAVFALNDDLAYGAINALFDAGYRVPDDVSVVGFNDEAMSEFFRPALTTVRSALRELGIQAVHLLLERVAATESPTLGRRVLIEPQLIVRESCGAKSRGVEANHLHPRKEDLTP